MKIAIAVLSNGMVNAHFGRANRIAFVTVENKEIADWKEEDAPFAAMHEEEDHHDHHHSHFHDHGMHQDERGHGDGAHEHDHDHDHDHGHGHGHGGKHQEVIKNYLVEHEVDLLLVDHAGPGLNRLLRETKIKVVTGAKGKAREVVQAAIDQGLVE